MAIFNSDIIGIDMGSAATAVYIDGLGVCLREPTQMLVSREDMRQVAAIGEEASRYADRAPEEIIAMPPVRDSAVTDIDLAALMMLAMAEKAAGRKKPMEKGRLLVSAATGLTHVEHAALLSAARLTGAKRVTAINSSVAAAIGAGLDVSEPQAVLLVDLGGGATEIAVLALSGVAASRSLRTAGLHFDEAIIRYMRTHKGLSIGARTAEEIKKTVGSALPPPEGSTGDITRVRGRDLKSGRPMELSVNAREISDALRESIKVLISAVQDVLIRLPAEYAADIKKSGIRLTGGCALLSGLTEALSAETGLPVEVTQSPQDDVANGLGAIGRDERLLRELIAAGSAVE